MREYVLTGPQTLHLELHPPRGTSGPHLVVRAPHTSAALTAADVQRALRTATLIERREECPACQGEGRLRRTTAYVDVNLGQWYPDEVDAGPCDARGCEDGQIWVECSADELTAELGDLLTGPFQPEPTRSPS
ncbi:hypothetical protein [Deinococcus soli (ex Cha et al. 2016)]|uniref:Uncharacterized protein n=2 Tax=Deinococcus soli (ex Cha et al. 2016) TaxID=1309411 RepID=A0ACC6KFI8_9DEIO|nr:hypothetical protein [Deinococcus soli (ex Cha et al. 2016)]MDR6218216.1 hypothetical protein [Deinococcus soli (ex Cha et al. 2016)]MDR6328956.1 hypothetical protein [Deinococcus soli (ex Cha et al. 2016)]MDR6751229.1 hypothetical protein [Deinococcus soli (ex Cha et al. 2016)]